MKVKFYFLAAFLVTPGICVAQWHPQDLSPDFYTESVATFTNPHTNADCTGNETPNYCCTGAGTGTCNDPVESFVIVNCETRNIDCVASGNPNPCCTGFQTGTCCYEQTDQFNNGRGSTYCPMSNPAVCPDGCVNQWVDQSGFKSAVGSHPITGRTFEQDDLEKPCYKSNCLNGHACVVGHPAWTEPDYPSEDQPSQDATMEIEPQDRTGVFAEVADQCPGAYYLAQLVRVVPQTEDHRLLSGWMKYLVDENRLRFGNTGGVDVSVDGVFPQLGEWYFIELQRASDETITLWVNQQDKTRSPTPSSSLRPWSTQNLCNGKTCDTFDNQEFQGEAALFFYKCGALSAGDRASLWNYVEDTFLPTSRPAVGINPRTIADLGLYLVSTAFEEGWRIGHECTALDTPYWCCTSNLLHDDCPHVWDRFIARNNSQTAHDDSATADDDIADLYCDHNASGGATENVGYAPEGCVRWWPDYSGWDCTDINNYPGDPGYPTSCATGDTGQCCQRNAGTHTHDDEWFQGHELGQSAQEKPQFIRDCVNGLPCAYFADEAEMFTDAGQPASLELQSFDERSITGDFSVFVLARTTSNDNDYCFLGSTGDCFGVDVSTKQLFYDSAGGMTSEGWTKTGESTNNAVVDGQWRLYEVHRDDSNELTYVVNGWDVTLGTQSDSGAFDIRYLGTNNGASGGSDSKARIAAVALYTSDLTEANRVGIREWLDRIYNYSGGYAFGPRILTGAGYTARANGMDWDDDFDYGDAQDAAACDSTGGSIVSNFYVEDVDGDATNEEQIFVDCDTAGNDDTSCGPPTDPCSTLNYAINTRADGNGDGQEDIICFKGLCSFDEIDWSLSGVTGAKTRTASGNEVRNFEYPKDPAVLMGWDSDGDNSYPPFDTDDTAIIVGGHYNIANSTCRRRVFTLKNNTISNMEMAHFKVYGYAECVTEEETPGGSFEGGFMEMDGAGTTKHDHLYFHDIEFERIAVGMDTESHGMIFEGFHMSNPIDWWAIENVLTRFQGNYFMRGSPPSTSNNWRLANITTIQLATIRQASWVKWWGQISGWEILDNHLDGFPYGGYWTNNTPVWGNPMGGVNACTQNVDARNNEARDTTTLFMPAVDSGACSIRPTSGHRYDRNVWIQEFPNFNNPTPSGVSECDHEASTVTDPVFSNNIYISRAGLNAFVLENCGYDSSGEHSYINNTYYLEPSAVLANGAFYMPCTAIEDDINLVNNIFDLPAGAMPIELQCAPAGWASDSSNYNAFPSGATYQWNNTNRTFAQWKSDSGGDTNSKECAPTYVDETGNDLHLASGDTCAKNSGTSASAYTTVDIDREGRPMGAGWDIGADEVVEAASQYTLTVTYSPVKNAGGTITSSPAGISCPGDCSESYNVDTVVTLTGTPSGHSYFSGWSGDADCLDGQVTMSAARACTGGFERRRGGRRP